MIVVDLDVPWVLDPDELKSKCKNTPFDEARLQGRVLRTIVAGRTVYEYASSVMLSRSIPPARGSLAFGYLLGSIPFGLVFTRLAGTQDIRAIGSGNIGATNVLRTGRKGLAAATLLADVLKGTVAVLVMSQWCGPRLRAARRRRRVPRPPVSGLADVQGRQGRRDLHRRAARAVVAGRAGVRRDLARVAAASALLVARLADRLRGGADLLLVSRRTARGRDRSCC